MLTLDVEFLLGVCFASRSPSDTAPDWPPQLDRVFSALVNTWAVRGLVPAEKDALEWLEQQDPPTVRASYAAKRQVSTVFVPPNDARPTQLSMLPIRRKRQERRFPAAIPAESTISYTWHDASLNASMLKSLQALACDTSYVGHSSSLVRCQFRESPQEPRIVGAATTRLRIYPGRLAELQRAYAEGRRPSPGEPTRRSQSVRESATLSVFGDEWFVFADAGGHCPDLRGAAIVGRAMRAAVMSGFEGRPVPEAISGHAEDGRPSGAPHMAILPLANVGWEWSDGRLMGLAICLPRAASAAEKHGVLAALASIIRARGSEEHAEITLDLPGAGKWRLALQMEPSASSLKPSRYLSAATTWATATPVALDRHPKEKGADALQAEIASIVADSCSRIGLPRPKLVVPNRHSAFRGSESSIPSRESPRWIRWGLPKALQGRPLIHATLVFQQPVSGPIVLGAGRFVGLGLCLPLDNRRYTDEES